MINELLGRFAEFMGRKFFDFIVCLPLGDPA